MPSIAEYAQMPVRITRDAIYIGDEQLPGCIATGGVTLKPGGNNDVNRLTVTFLCGPVTADDPWVTQAEVTTKGDTTVHYDSKRPARNG